MRAFLVRIGHALNGGDPAAPGPDPLHIVADGPLSSLDVVTATLLDGTAHALGIADDADAIASLYRTARDARRAH
jgi:hypothetical protein